MSRYQYGYCGAAPRFYTLVVRASIQNAKFCHQTPVKNGLESGGTPVDTVVSTHSNELPGITAVPL
jgi:hypothetical protein